MQTDPVEEWRRLSTLYGEMGDVEIEELAAQINDLTPTAQDVLREEIKKRGITGESRTPRVRAEQRDGDAEVHWDHENDGSGEYSDGSSGDGVVDYTWKVELCRCESPDEAAARSEMLRRAGIDSWIQRRSSFGGDIQINVGADQLDEARGVVSQPIPQSILDRLKEEAASFEYEIPTCPKCGVPDPTLESVEPSNNWLCESCEYTWSDAVSDPTTTQGEAK